MAKIKVGDKREGVCWVCKQKCTLTRLNNEQDSHSPLLDKPKPRQPQEREDNSLEYDCYKKACKNTIHILTCQGNDLRAEIERLKGVKHITMVQAEQQALFSIERTRQRRDWATNKEAVKELKAEIEKLKAEGLKGNIPLVVLDQVVRQQEQLQQKDAEIERLKAENGNLKIEHTNDSEAILGYREQLQQVRENCPKGCVVGCNSILKIIGE